MIRKPTALAGAIIATSALLIGCQNTDPVPYDGQNLFLGYCAACHGPTGTGDGPMAPSLATTLPDLRSLTTRNDGVFPREQLVDMIDGRSLRTVHGTAEMPVWGFQFRREEGMTQQGLRNVDARINALIDHIESLQQ